MPIGLLPSDIFSVKSSLDADRESRVTFKVRAVSVADVRKIGQLRREASEQKTFEAENSKLNEALLVGIVGWDLPQPATDEGFDAALTLSQKYQLSAELSVLSLMSEVDRKVQRLSEISAPVISARPVAEENATIPQPLQAP